MKKLNFIVSLSTNTNDFQTELAATALAAGQKLDVTVQIIYAQNDPILQSQQLLKMIQLPGSSHPDAIFFHPFGSTALAQVARAAAAAGIGVAVLNWQANYVSELRQNYHVPIFIYSSDHRQIGHIQALQFAALLPEGGNVLYIRGPSGSYGAEERAAGMAETKPENIQIKSIRTPSWTEEGGYRAVSSWLRLSTANDEPIDLIAAQNDLIAIGARKAFAEIANEFARERWLNLPYTGIDGLPQTGQVWVRKGLLASTIVVPPNAGLAVEAMEKAIRTGIHPPECILTVPKSYPSIEDLKMKREASRIHSSGGHW